MVEASQLDYVQTNVTCEQLQKEGRQDMDNTVLLCTYKVVILCCIL